MDWRRRRLEGYGGLWIRAVGGERGGVDWEASGEGGWIRLPAADVAVSALTGENFLRSLRSRSFFIAPSARVVRPR